MIVISGPAERALAMIIVDPCCAHPSPSATPHSVRAYILGFEFCRLIGPGRWPLQTPGGKP